jgi:hypothetical protein
MSDTAKTVSGARAKVYITDDKGITQLVGIFNHVSYSTATPLTPVYILGKYEAAALEYTHHEPVQIRASGWRVLKNGPYMYGAKKASELLTAGYMQFEILERETNTTIAKLMHVKHQGFSGAVTARQLEEMGMDFMGILIDDSDNVREVRDDDVRFPGMETSENTSTS